MRRTGVRLAIALVGLCAFALAGSPGFAAVRATKSCGNVAGVPVHARDISCYRGEVGQSSEYMWWKRTTYRPLAGSVVLGGEVYAAPTGEGWGTPHPSFIYNGGDASGSIDDVTWSSWGGAVAHGRGRHPIFKPRGGYYRHPVVALLKATDLGRCEGRSAYLRLLIREPRRPGGPLGPWRSWAGPQTLCEPYGSSFGRPLLALASGSPRTAAPSGASRSSKLATAI